MTKSNESECAKSRNTSKKSIKRNAEKAKKSKSYEKAKNKAEEYATDSKKLNELIEKASIKATRTKGPLDASWIQLSACFRLLRAYANGDYRETPWSSLVMIVASVIYFVMPIDLLPDFIVGLGLVDDASLLVWTAKTCNADIDAFTVWEQESMA